MIPLLVIFSVLILIAALGALPERRAPGKMEQFMQMVRAEEAAAGAEVQNSVPLHQYSPPAFQPTAIPPPRQKCSRFHDVKSGDTLFSLGGSTNDGLARIRQANGFSGDQNLITVGQTLCIP